jgi:hypothetical protein
LREATHVAMVAAGAPTMPIEDKEGELSPSPAGAELLPETVFAGI